MKTQSITKANGRRFVLQQGPLCETLAVESRARVWTLYEHNLDSENYVGNFRTKREAMEEINKICEGPEYFSDYGSLKITWCQYNA